MLREIRRIADIVYPNLNVSVFTRKLCKCDANRQESIIDLHHVLMLTNKEN